MMFQAIDMDILKQASSDLSFFWLCTILIMGYTLNLNRGTGMNLPSAPGEASVNSDRQSKGETRLHGHWLILARMLWIAIFILTLVVFCANLIVGSYGLVPTILIVANTSMWFAVSLVLFWRKSAVLAILLFSLLLVFTW